MGYAFISYSSKNTEDAKALNSALVNKGIKTWMAPGDIPAGSKYADVITKAIKGAECLVILLTDDALSSIWVDKEVERALSYRKPVVPVALGELELNDSFELYLGNQQIVPVKQISDENDEFLKIIDQIVIFTSTESVEENGAANAGIQSTKMWELSYLTLEQKRIMRLFSIFKPEKVIYGAIEKWATFNAYALDSLVRLGWIDRVKNGFIIHQDIKDSVVLHMKDQGEELKIEEYGELLDSVININSYIPRDLEYTEVQERLVLAENVAEYLDNRVKEIVEVNGYSEEKEYFLKRAAMLFDGIAGVYEIHCNYVQALYYFRKAYELNMIFDPNHPCTGRSYNNMGRIYHALGDDANAEDCYGKAIEILGRALSPDHSELIGPYNNMAVLLSERGNYDKALYYFGKVRAICKREGGDNHPYLIDINNNIAQLLYAQGDYDKALEYCGKTFAILKRVTYPEHPMNASPYNIMGDVFIAQGNYVRALESYGKALAILQRVPGEEHPLLATTYKGFALVYLNQGKYSIALEYIDKALSIYEHKLGADHHETRAAEQVKDQIKSHL